MRWLRALFGIKKCKNSTTVQLDQAKEVSESMVNKSKRWQLWKPITAGGGLDMSKSSVDRKRSMSARYVHPEDCIYLKYYRRQWAAIRIQSAFRGFLARRARKALKAIVRIQAIFRGRRVRHILQAYMNQLHINQEVKKKEWCDEQGSIGEIEARQQHKQAAAIRRERAMAYALQYRRGAMRGASESKGPEFWQLWDKWLKMELQDKIEEEEIIEEAIVSKHHSHSSKCRCRNRSRSKAMVMTPDQTWSSYYYSDHHHHSGPISPLKSSSSSTYNTHHDNCHHVKSRSRRKNNCQLQLDYPITSNLNNCKVPGYMDGTISMTAKCRNLEFNRKCSRHIPSSPNRSSRRHSSMACIHNHHINHNQNHNILLQCTS